MSGPLRSLLSDLSDKSPRPTDGECPAWSHSGRIRSWAFGILTRPSPHSHLEVASSGSGRWPRSGRGFPEPSFQVQAGVNSACELCNPGAPACRLSRVLWVQNPVVLCGAEPQKPLSACGRHSSHCWASQHPHPAGAPKPGAAAEPRALC